jgi:hypothetical protein
MNRYDEYFVKYIRPLSQIASLKESCGTTELRAHVFFGPDTRKIEMLDPGPRPGVFPSTFYAHEHTGTTV